jgi:hypothetical protein
MLFDEDGPMPNTRKKLRLYVEAGLFNKSLLSVQIHVDAIGKSGFRNKCLRDLRLFFVLSIYYSLVSDALFTVLVKIMQGIAEATVVHICGAYDTLVKPVILSREGGIILLWQKWMAYANKALSQHVSKWSLKVDDDSEAAVLYCLLQGLFQIVVIKNLVVHDFTRAALESTSGMRKYSLQGMIYMVKSLDDLQTMNELAGLWLQVTISDTFLGGEQQVCFAVLAIYWSNMIFKLEVKLVFKVEGVVRDQNYWSNAISIFN